MRIFSFVLLSLFVGTISYKIGQWQGFPISKSLIRKTIAGGLATLTISAGPLTSLAEEWTDRNRLAAETWRAVDEIFYDRTFNGNDWFQLRQEVVKKSYKNDEEVYQSLQTMLAELGDKYTRYLTPAQYSALLNSATGELVGLGVELVSESEDPTAKPSTIVANVQEESPAAEMGIMKGDKIINVDGTSAIGLSPEEVASIIRGKENTKATIKVERGGSSLDLAAIRKPLKLKGVTSGQFEFTGSSNSPIVKSIISMGRDVRTNSKLKVGFVKIRSFSSTTRDEVTSAMEKLHKNNFNDPLDALVIDLRNNGGGLLQGAVETSNLFMKPGKIVVFVVAKEGNPEAQQTLPNGVISTDTDLPDLQTPMFLLVDGNTASAAEVFAAAMKENDRGVLVGEKTFGKGVIQNLQQLRQGGVAVTIAKYETPKHNNINKIGINVDIPATCVYLSSTADCFDQLTK